MAKPEFPKASPVGSHGLRPKAYEPNQYEDAIYAAWEQSGFFNPDNLPGKRREAFSIVLPPPNVTGTLHMGHAVMLALEDIMTRFARMRGKKALWVPGTDHAAIATQAKVEKLLMEKGMRNPRQELGREKFLREVEKFAAESHDIIVNQSKKMGASLDWSREAYTLDAARSRAVNAAFKMMYDDGLIYRGNRVVNWCPHCKSTLADDEVEYQSGTAKLFTFRYDKKFPIPISSTRPETKFGDTAVAVHPTDERYKKFVGQTFQAMFAGKPLTIKVIADASIDPAFGTGVLGATPAHSHADADLAYKNNLAFVQVIGEDGKMTSDAGPEFSDLSAKEAREKLVERLRKDGLIEKEEDVPQNLSVCYRCGTAVEPLPKLQWFINVNKPFKFRASKHAPIKGLKNGEMVTLKQVMQHVVRSGEVEIVPDRFNKTYFHWIDNLRDWNISRQIWFGHRVPVWYCRNCSGPASRDVRSQGADGSVRVRQTDERRQAPNGMIVATEPPARCPVCAGSNFTQDPDTLDTWFSSGLWTISTLGWPSFAKASEGRPEIPKENRKFHPTSVLETGYDILFFWVARMILMTTYAVGEVPFRKVYLHGLVRDEKGRKMSKSLGNVIDPLDMIKKFGADATRLSLVIGSTPGNDVKLSEEKVAGYRNFTNKLWNISRFVLGTVAGVARVSRVVPETLADRWILSRFAEVAKKVTDHLEAYEFSAAGERLRDFTWSEFADWYLEIAKIQKNQNTDRILLYILERLLVLWHPFMPFVTEEIWSSFPLLTKEGVGEVAERMLIVHSWPKVKKGKADKAMQDFQRVMDVIVALRNLRAEFKVEPVKEISATIVAGKHTKSLAASADIIRRLTRVHELAIVSRGEKPAGSAASVAGGVTIFLPLAGLVDTGKERARLAKDIEEAKKYLAGRLAQLNNKEFMAKAPAAVIETLKKNKEEAEKKVAEIEKQLKAL